MGHPELKNCFLTKRMSVCSVREKSTRSISRKLSTNILSTRSFIVDVGYCDMTPAYDKVRVDIKATAEHHQNIIFPYVSSFKLCGHLPNNTVKTSHSPKCFLRITYIISNSLFQSTFLINNNNQFFRS